MTDNVKKEISLIYEQRRSAAEDALEKRRREIFARIPQLADIDEQIKSVGIRLGHTAISGDREGVERLKSEMQGLLNKKNQVLKENSIEEETLKKRYYCCKCNDTGFITDRGSAEKCSCYREIIIESLYKNLKLDPNRTMTFDKFNINFYSDKVDRERYGEDISPRDKMSSNYVLCRNFVDRFDDTDLKNILIYGSVGIGKTFMCACIANALIERANPVLYISAVDMFNIITAERMGKTESNIGKPEIKDFINIELLIIDDLGTESLTESRCSEFLEILNKKKEINSKRPCRILISTNLTPREIVERYSERIGSRITSEFIKCKFIGEDIRMIDR